MPQESDTPLPFSIFLEKKGLTHYIKASYPVRYGIYHEIKTRDYVFHFNPQGEIKFIQGRGYNWPHPSEWMKRTAGNDWVYYSSGDYGRTFSYFGEYYFPIPFYPSNSIMGYKPKEFKGVRDAFSHLNELYNVMETLKTGRLPPHYGEFFEKVLRHKEKTLAERAAALHKILGERVTVLPPDARHVDYDVIPIVISEGCLYNCGFCRVKSGKPLTFHSKSNIEEQIMRLKDHFALDLRNYNSLFLAHHDTIGAEKSLIEFTLEMAYKRLDLENAYIKQPRLFMFGSVDSFLDAEEGLFFFLNNTPFLTYINIGLESACDATLRMMKKPITSEKVRATFERIHHVNNSYDRIEITANFVISSDFPESHLDTFFRMTGKNSHGGLKKGTIYVSPIYNDRKEDKDIRRKLLGVLEKIKVFSTHPVYLYLIQRL